MQTPAYVAALAASLPVDCTALRSALALLSDDTLNYLAATTSTDAHRTNVANGAWFVLNARYESNAEAWPVNVADGASPR